MITNNLLFIIGTRPELIKVFPIIKYLKDNGCKNFRLVSTGQHLDLLKPYWKLFGFLPDYELEIMSKGQSLIKLNVSALNQIDDLLQQIKSEFKADLIVAQGDTTTVMAASMVAFFNHIPYAHIEAGLRSFDLEHPFPEEFNRRISSVATNLHFAPTEIARQNLIHEGYPASKIKVVGNTVVDTLEYFRLKGLLKKHQWINRKLAKVEKSSVLITCHRRENHVHIQGLLRAVEYLADKEQDTNFVWIIHPNPMVYDVLMNSSLQTKNNIILVDPLEYIDLLKMISFSKMILTDSGGIQEEAPSFQVPVLILRETTERPEAVDLGVAKLIGMNENSIIDNYYNFKPEYSSPFKNPYGDGKASKRIVNELFNFNNSSTK